MIIRRRDYLEILARLKPDRLDLVHPDEAQATAIVEYAKILNAVHVQAERVFQESGHDISTPARAALALALHRADPDAFDFPACKCGPYPLSLCAGDPAACPRRRFVEQCRDRARRPLPISQSILSRIFTWLRS